MSVKCNCEGDMVLLYIMGVINISVGLVLYFIFESIHMKNKFTTTSTKAIIMFAFLVFGVLMMPTLIYDTLINSIEGEFLE